MIIILSFDKHLLYLFYRNSITPTNLLKLSPGATVIFTDKTSYASSTVSDTEITTESTKTSSGTRSFIAFKILLMSVCLNKLYNRAFN